MKITMKWLSLLLLVLCVGQPGNAQQLPKLFLVGDSISIYYTPFLQADTASLIQFSRKTSPTPETIAQQLSDPNVQGGNSRMVLDYLKGRYADKAFHPEFVAINCGLHDIKRIPKTNAIAIDAAEYRDNLAAILALVQSRGGHLVWINTTPVNDARHNALSKEFFRYNADVKRYNEIAEKLFKQSNVPTIDLYTFTAQMGDGHYIDHVHFDEPTRMLQAAFIAGFLNSYLSSPVPSH
jgi:lysophospholipase L1-like esterase